MSQAQDADYQPKPKVIEQPERVGDGFDLRTHIKDAKTGELIKVQPYRRFSIGLSTFYERPKFSGNLFYEDGKLAGRRTQNSEGLWTIDTKAPHIEFTEEKTSYRTADLIEQENDALRAELVALKSEKDAKLDKKPAQQAPQKK